MSVHQVLTVVLGLAQVLVTTSCEEPAEGIAVGITERVPVLTCLCVAGEPLTVSVTGSVTYGDTVAFNSIDTATVHVSLGDSLTYHLGLRGPEHLVTFSSVRPEPGDAVTVRVEALGAELSGRFSVPDSGLIASVDTSQYGSLLRFTVHMLDNVTRTDHYQLLVYRREWRGGEAKDSLLECRYESYLFNAAQVNIGFGNVQAGLFTDDGRLPGLYLLTLSTLRRGFDLYTGPYPRPAAWTPPDSLAAVVTLFHHSEEYYSFLQTALNTQNSLLLPVFGSATVYNNVQGGQGIVASTARSEYTLRTYPGKSR